MRQETVPYVVVPHKGTVSKGKSNTNIELKLENHPVPAPLSVRTHVRYHVSAAQVFNIRPRPAPAPTRTLTTYQSGWIKVQDWEDVSVVPLVEGDVHVNFDSRGFVQA